MLEKQWKDFERSQPETANPLWWAAWLSHTTKRHERMVHSWKRDSLTLLCSELEMLAALSLPFFNDWLASFSCIFPCSLSKTPCLVSRSFRRQEGGSANHFLWSKWNDRVYYSPATVTGLLFLFFKGMYWLLLGCEENFDKWSVSEPHNLM